MNLRKDHCCACFFSVVLEEASGGARRFEMSDATNSCFPAHSHGVGGRVSSFSQKVVPVVRDRLLRVQVCMNGWLSFCPVVSEQKRRSKNKRSENVASCLVAAKQKSDAK